MARLNVLPSALLLGLLLVEFAVSADPPGPAPQPAGDSPSPPPEGGAPASSPPAPPPSDLAPGSSPTPSPVASPSKSSPAPAPTDASDMSPEKNGVTADVGEESKESSDGLSGGQKVGIVLGVIAGACLVGFGGLLYKKRQQNIQRSQYGYAARREIL
ncbi:hypothetical protein F0562_002087 [Nyssa sinensis]|uniref:Uncharacterized protein n=1 Tax=Nyssa sinensis TaxID=561372 RepID=A0A5J5C4S9_9ASTE|nr:hypothetical protein F0562_002087 [Nyssa sinensis]